MELPRHGEDVAPVKLTGLFVQPAGRAEVSQLKPAAHVPDAMAQHVQSTPAGNLGGQPLEELLLYGGPVMLGKTHPLLGLGHQHKVQHVLRDEAQGSVIVAGCPLPVAAGHRVQEGTPFLPNQPFAILEKAGFYGIFKGPFRNVYLHPASSLTSMRPVTAAEIRALRSSL